MKRSLLALFFFAFALSSKAQYVYITDSAFAGWLNTTYPQCMNGNLMDTTCYAITHETTVEIIGSDYVTSFNGIQYFDSLQIFNCVGDISISSIPPLPNHLIHFDCHSCGNITTIPSLPSTLTYFDCSFCNQSQLPVLPNGLILLDCQNNLLTILPTLPDSLVLLRCSYNQITQIPTLPNKLRELYCNNCQLNSLPNLPNTIFGIGCVHNQLHNLPTLPDSLTSFDCANNFITYMPSIPNKATQIFCNNNSITSIPDMPNTVYQIDCSHNQVTSLGQLPHWLNFLDVSYNPISCLPKFDSIEGLSISNTNILCLPDSAKVGTLIPANPNFPRCDSIDPNQCVHCNAHFAIYPDTSNQGVYYGINQSSGSNLSYLWDFGDSSISASPYPLHNYSQPGHFYVCLTVSNNSGCSNTYCDSSFYVFKTEGGLMSELHILNPATGISQLPTAAANFFLSPNPFTSSLSIYLQNKTEANITLTDVLGRKVMAVQLNTSYSTLNTSNLPTGVYFLEVIQDGERVVKQVVKENP